MSTGGIFIRERRNELEIKARTLAELTGISRDRLYRIERGESRAPSALELQHLAENLGVPFADLKAMFTAPMFDLGLVDQYINALERGRVWAGDTKFVAMNAANLVNELKQRASLVVSSTDRKAIQRRLVKAQIVLAANYAMIAEKHDFTAWLADDIWEIQRSRSLLTADDSYYRDWAIVLPAMLYYINENYRLAAEWLSLHWGHLVDPSVRALCLRDQLVSTAWGGDSTQFKLVMKRAEQALDDANFLTIGGRAKVREGQAAGALLLKLPEGRDYLESAVAWMNAAIRRDERHRFTESQIACCKFDFALVGEPKDRAYVVAMAHEAVTALRIGPYRRSLLELKSKLLLTEWPELRSFCKEVLDQVLAQSLNHGPYARPPGPPEAP